ncbi:GNAT family N-acetyltransferase [Halalkalibacterium ligniniphilum]|uniref:GNAT family N-acetyltransferase n=1 Tax=Halalkalibacterium ligniniphilum TaxID=1134413 RepID=UPI00034A6F91|nr:GNAT family N-acetyltransferase [Halalkalibacterium ligniniphilum]
MENRLATAGDAPIIHALMIRAFEEYRHAEPPSSALDETIESISSGLQKDEQAFIHYLKDKAVGMLRFHVRDDHIYFFRLSVVPEHQGKGVAKKLLKVLENYAKKHHKATITCKVRVDVPRNIHLYESIGYHICEKERIPKPKGNVNVVSMKKTLMLT